MVQQDEKSVTGKQGRMRRRGLIAGAAALVGGLLAKQAGEGTVSAADGDPLVLGNSGATQTGAQAETKMTWVYGAVAGAPGLRFDVNRNNNSTFDAKADGIQGFAVGANLSGTFGRNNEVDGVGIWGEAPNGTGAFGDSGAGSGVAGNSTSGAGVFGQSVSADGTKGQSTSGNGLTGISSSGYGVVGFTTGGSASMSGITTNAAIPAFAGGTSAANGLAAHFTGGVFVDCATVGGHFVVSPMSAKSGLLKHPDGTHRLMYCMEAPESWAEDFGTGTLVNGVADVQLDPEFAPLIEPDYHVFLSGYDAHNHLIVKGRHAGGFSVEADMEIAKLKGKSAAQLTGSFSWRVVAKPKSDRKVERLAKYDPPQTKLPDVNELTKPTTLPHPRKK